MGNKLFVGGLPWATDDAGLAKAFSQFGDVSDAKVILDRETGRSRGFGFVTFETDDQAEAARAAMDGGEIEGRRVTVRIAQERGPKRPETIRRRTPVGAPSRDRDDRGDQIRSWSRKEPKYSAPDGGDNWGAPADPTELGWAEDKQRRKDRGKKKKRKRGRFDEEDDFNW